MSFLTLNELTIPTSVTRGTESVQIVGDATRAYDGTLLESRSTEKDVWALATRVIPQEEGEALKSLLLGHGRHWSFDVDRYDDGKGLVPSAGAAAGTITGGGKFGSYIALAAAEQITWPTGGTGKDSLAGDYTIMLYDDAAGTPVHYTIRNTGGVIAKWVDLVRNDAALTPFVSVNGSGELTIGDGVGAWDLDDLVALPVALPEDYILAFAARTRAFSNLPELTAEGDLTNGKQVTVQARSSSVRVRAQGFQNQATGLWERYGHVVTFDLLEV